MSAAIYPVTIYYDASCPLCNAEMGNLMLRNVGEQLQFVDISATPGAQLLDGVSWSQMMAIIHARRSDGQIVSGVEVFRLAYEAVGLGWITAATRWPLLGRLADLLYPHLAANRNRIPRCLVHSLFEKQARRAAQVLADRRNCNAGQCSVGAEKGVAS